MDFFKMTFQAVCNTAVNENILQSCKYESAPSIKLLSLKRKSRLSIIEMSHWASKVKINI